MKAHQLAAIAVAALGLAVAQPAAAAQAAGLGAFVGTWRINLDRSTMGRAGPSGVQTRRSPTFTWRFSPAGAGLMMEIFPEFPAPAASKRLPVVPDGRQHVCPMQESCLSAPGDPKEQSYAFMQVGPRMLVRAFMIRGENTEYNVYALSADGKSFVATSWNPQTPEFRNVQVFERQP